jgi:hypothetical protein
MCLVDGRLNIVPPIIPEAQEFVHFNDLWCYLFYKLTGEEKDDKGIAAFTIVPAKNLTVAALLDRVFPAIPATDNKPMPYVTTKTVAYIFAFVIDSVTISSPIDALISNTELWARQNCSSEPRGKA